MFVVNSKVLSRSVGHSTEHARLKEPVQIPPTVAYHQLSDGLGPLNGGMVQPHTTCHHGVGVGVVEKIKQLAAPQCDIIFVVTKDGHSNGVVKVVLDTCVNPGPARPFGESTCNWCLSQRMQAGNTA